MKPPPSDLASIDLAQLQTVTGGRLFGGGGGLLGGGGLFGWRNQMGAAGCPNGNCGGAAPAAPATGG